MTNLQEEARQLFVKVYNDHRASSSAPTITLDEVYIVWFSKVLQNWKALISTTLPDGKYYEMTYNGDEGETYLDEYIKRNNIVIPDPNRVPSVLNHDHKATQHRDGREPWCRYCGLNADRLMPKMLIGPRGMTKDEYDVLVNGAANNGGAPEDNGK